MAKLQEVFERIKQTKKEQREIKKIYRDALSTNNEYQNLVEKLNDMKEKKKQLEEVVKGDFKSEWNKLEGMKLHIASDYELLSDLAINQLVKGEKVEVFDDRDEYEPVFNVRFVKAK